MRSLRCIGHEGTTNAPRRWSSSNATEAVTVMRGILLWFLGIPIPIIILLYLFNVL